jgi:argininosuccinate lyase
VLSGRIDAVPAQVWHDEVLAPQFAYEVEHLLPWYVAIEKVLLLEYVRLGLIDSATAHTVARRLDEVTPDLVRADPAANMSDIAFALERHVTDAVAVPNWHVDRSRNDFQAAAQLLAARDWTAGAAESLLTIGGAVADLAGRTADLPMPGQTHFQAAQVVSPGFHLAALGEETLRTLRRLRFTYAELDASPLGSGAMAGQELAWDRDRMARLLGFGRVQPHALVGVASRGWALSVSADVAAYGVALGRFATDLMTWGGSGHGFLDLPDSLSGISSAMPQKKNFPVLERIRGRCAHLTAYQADLAITQRATPYTNLVEVSKEAGANLLTLFTTLRSALRLFTAVIANLEFRADRMRAACEREYLGGFTLANLLTLRGGIPWRQAQVIAGRYISAAIERGLPPSTPDGALLASLAAVDRPHELLAEAFDVDRALTAKTSSGGTHPDEVRALVALHIDEYADHAAFWAQRRAQTDDALTTTDSELGLGSATRVYAERDRRGSSRRGMT